MERWNSRNAFRGLIKDLIGVIIVMRFRRLDGMLKKRAGNGQKQAARKGREGKTARGSRDEFSRARDDRFFVREDSSRKDVTVLSIDLRLSTVVRKNKAGEFNKVFLFAAAGIKFDSGGLKVVDF